MGEYMFVFGPDIAAERAELFKAMVQDHLEHHQDLNGLILGGLREPFSLWDLSTGRTYEYRPAVKPVLPPPDMALMEAKHTGSAIGLVVGMGLLLLVLVFILFDVRLVVG